jgi:hypothetical protein
MAQVKRYAGSNIPSIRPVKGGGLSFDIMVRKCSNSGLTSLNAYWEEKMQEEVYIVRARISLTWHRLCGDFGVRNKQITSPGLQLIWRPIKDKGMILRMDDYIVSSGITKSELIRHNPTKLNTD